MSEKHKKEVEKFKYEYTNEQKISSRILKMKIIDRIKKYEIISYLYNLEDY